MLIFGAANVSRSEGHSNFIDPGGIKIAVTNDPVITADTASFVLPFTKAGKLILVKGKVDTTEGNFVFDTGAPGLVLNVTYFRSYPVSEINEDERKGIAGSADFYGHTTVDKFKLGAFNYYHTEADLVNLGHLESKRGIKILGLLGVSLFTQCEMIIDYEKNEIHLHYISKKEKNTYQHEMLAHATRLISCPFELQENRILVKSDLLGKELKFVIDYGAESNILDSRLPEKILDSLQITGRVLLNGAATQKLEAVMGTVQGFAFAGIKTDSLPVIVTNLEYTCFGDGRCIDGVLGYDFLSHYKLCFNFVKRIVYVIQ
ncbi:MAG: aspartyl protease family protein [Bacteroidetes bacterium]|nr:aspartyl protease family protein [Bacteroidota bacterium]